MFQHVSRRPDACATRDAATNVDRPAPSRVRAVLGLRGPRRATAAKGNVGQLRSAAGVAALTTQTAYRSLPRLALRRRRLPD